MNTNGRKDETSGGMDKREGKTNKMCILVKVSSGGDGIKETHPHPFLLPLPLLIPTSILYF